jgi:hypothetical protein
MNSHQLHAFCVDGRSPDVLPSSVPKRLRLEFEKAIHHARAQHNSRRKIVREDADRRRLIGGLEFVRPGCAVSAFRGKRADQEPETKLDPAKPPEPETKLDPAKPPTS